MPEDERVVGESPSADHQGTTTQWKALLLGFVLWRGTIITPPRDFVQTNGTMDSLKHESIVGISGIATLCPPKENYDPDWLVRVIHTEHPVEAVSEGLLNTFSVCQVPEGSRTTAIISLCDPSSEVPQVFSFLL